MKAIIYARQSSGQNDESVSIDEQVAAMERLAATRGLEIAGTYKDYNTSGETYPAGDEAIAERDLAFAAWYAGQTRRPQFRAGLGAALTAVAEIAHSDGAAALLIYDQTRLARPVTNSFLEAHLAQRLRGIRLFTKEGELDLWDHMGGLYATIVNHINFQQIQHCKEKAMASIRRLRSEGIVCSGAPLYGYRYDLNTRAYRAVAAELADVRLVYARFLAGGTSIAALCRELNADPGRRRRWTSTKVARLLRHCGYCGLMRPSPHAEPIPAAAGTYDEIAVSKADWLSVQACLAGRRRCYHAKRFNYALSGLMHCGYCGRALSVNTMGGWSGLGVVDYSGKVVTRAYCPAHAEEFCGTVLTRYGNGLPLALGVPPAYPERKYATLGGRLQRWNATHGLPPEQDAGIAGLAEAIMPLLAAECMDRIAIIQSARVLEQRRAAELRLAETEESRKRLVGLVADGLLAIDEIRERLVELKARKAAAEAELLRLEAATRETSVAALQRAYAMLEAIQTGTLHPDDFRELFLVRYTGVDVYAGSVVLRRRDGGAIRLGKRFVRATVGMPRFRLEVGAADDGFRAEVTYYYASYYDGDAALACLYRDARLTVWARGREKLGKPDYRSRYAIARRKGMAKEEELLAALPRPLELPGLSKDAEAERAAEIAADAAAEVRGLRAGDALAEAADALFDAQMDAVRGFSEPPEGAQPA